MLEFVIMKDVTLYMRKKDTYKEGRKVGVLMALEKLDGMNSPV